MSPCHRNHDSVRQCVSHFLGECNALDVVMMVKLRNPTTLAAAAASASPQRLPRGQGGAPSGYIQQDECQTEGGQEYLQYLQYLQYLHIYVSRRGWRRRPGGCGRRLTLPACAAPCRGRWGGLPGVSWRRVSVSSAVGVIRSFEMQS